MEKKIWFNLKKTDWHNHSSESMWTTKIDDNQFKLKNIPLYAYEISYHDIFSIKEDNDGTPIFDKIIQKSGNSTYRLIKNNKTSLQVINTFLHNLEKLGVSYESQDDRVFALNIPKSSDINLIYQKFEEGENQDLFGFEEADYCSNG